MTTNVTGKVKSGADAKRVCLSLAKHYGASIKYGPDSETVQVLAAALDAIGVTDKRAFLRNVSITVGDTIYLPFQIGVSGRFPWTAQVAVVAHECEHVFQGGFKHLLFWLRYFSSKAHRAEYEVEALAVELEVYYRLTGFMLDVNGLAKGLAWYKVSKTDIAVVAKHLAIVKNTLKRGGEISNQMRVIVKTLI
jgi:hypothetical protein